MMNSVFHLSSFREMGLAVGVIRRFGSEQSQQTLNQMQERLYAV